MSRALLARTLSIVGHPALLMPAAVAWAAVQREASPRVLQVALGISIFVAVTLGLYSLAMVRAGRWTHIDASIPHERRQLNLFAACLLFGTALLLAWGRQPGSIATGLAVSGAVVVLAHLTRRWLKLSLHAAFAVFAATLLWPSPIAAALLAALALGVAWSRLVLRRHTPVEVIVGLLVGGLAGVVFDVSLRRFA